MTSLCGTSPFKQRVAAEAGWPGAGRNSAVAQRVKFIPASRLQGAAHCQRRRHWLA